MGFKELRQSFLNFFEKNGHVIVPSSSLIPEDTSVLFTTAGMQQFKPYYLGEKSPHGDNVASSQKCFRTSDIEQVGDETHLTFLEMLGNFSFDGYFKKEAINFAHEFITSQTNLLIDYVTVFGGDKEIPPDQESVKIWEKLGFSEKKGNLKFSGREDNFWGPTGLEGPCGPTTEIYIQGTEIWNLVFNEYYQDKNKKLTPLQQKGVDTGMGLERLAMVVQGKDSVFETDLLWPIIAVMSTPGVDKLIEKTQTKPYALYPRPYRIIADHIKGTVFLVAEGIFPSNVERGYVLRRILRRAIRYGKLLNLPRNFLIPLAKKTIEIYQDIYPEVQSRKTDILNVIQAEEEKFEKTLSQGLKVFEKITQSVIGKQESVIAGLEVFHLFDTYGFPLETTQELAQEKGLKIDKEGFEREFKKHQEVSRSSAAGKFVGGLADNAPQTIKLHTAHHLLLAALQQVLGPQVKQRGSHINQERLRLDFSFDRKLSEEEMNKVEGIVNQKIKEDFEVVRKEMPRQEAERIGAQMEFGTKYPQWVSVYFIQDKQGNVFSKEFCGGPHVKKTSELDVFKIIKEESVGSGLRRIKAVLNMVK